MSPVSFFIIPPITYHQPCHDRSTASAFLLGGGFIQTQIPQSYIDKLLGSWSQNQYSRLFFLVTVVTTNNPELHVANVNVYTLTCNIKQHLYVWMYVCYLFRPVQERKDGNKPFNCKTIRFTLFLYFLHLVSCRFWFSLFKESVLFYKKYYFYYLKLLKTLNSKERKVVLFTFEYFLGFWHLRAKIIQMSACLSALVTSWSSLLHKQSRIKRETTGCPRVKWISLL